VSIRDGLDVVAGIRCRPSEDSFFVDVVAASRPFDDASEVVRVSKRLGAEFAALRPRWVRVFVSDEEGHEVELNVLGPGEFFGELMLGSQVRTATVQTTTRAKLTMITRAEFEQALGERPSLAFHVIQQLIDRVRQLSRNVQGLVSMDVYGRVVRLFTELARDEGGQRVVPGPLSQQKIADRVGASRSMINRILQDLAAGGYIEASRERIVLRKPLPKRW